MTEVFEGISVLDFSWGWPGSIATMVMSDFGAEVIKVDPPGGDPFRSLPASVQWNRGKKSIVLDMKSPEGREQAKQLALQSDVVVTSFRPGVVERLGIDYESLSAQRPDLVFTSITGFGPKGPYSGYKGYEGAVAAKIGRMMASAGQARLDGPQYMAVNVASHSAAMASVRGTTAALLVRDRTGQGQKLETSLLQCFSTYDLRDWIIWQMMFNHPEQFPSDMLGGLRRQPVPGYLPIRTADGRWIQMANIVPRPFRQSMQVMGLGSIFEDPRFKTAPMLLPEDQEVLREMMLTRAKEKTLDEWMDLFINGDPAVAAEPFVTSEAGMNHPQVVHNGHIQDVQDPRVGKTRQLGPVAMLKDTPGSIKGAASALGEHTQEVLARLNGSQPRARSYNNEPLPKLPLEGISVIDMATVIAGPMGCSLLAQLGARVIRVETRDGDFMRINASGIMANSTMGGTEGISLDLKAPEGQEIVQKLISTADILVHNMRPGAPERVGLGYEQIRHKNPKLIYVYAAGYGSGGPHSHRPSMHPAMGAAFGGVLAQLGRDVLPPPDQHLTMEETKEMARRLYAANEANPDPNTSAVISTACTMGLYAREKTGKGQYIETTMLCANAYANADDFFWYEGKPPREIPDGEGYGLNALYRLYKAGQGWVFLACPMEEEWRALCGTIGRADLVDDSRFATQETRRVNDDALARELAQVFIAREPHEWESLLAAADVVCVKAEDRGPYHFFNDDPHIKENNFISEIELPRLGKVWRYGPVLTYSHTSTRVGPGPLRGQHTRDILLEIGYSEDQIRDLKNRTVVDWDEG
jgi:crotonobetainyl-CoA:carnitine CoA-transferase CaiB-like acyl-CoA transferase